MCVAPRQGGLTKAALSDTAVQRYMKKSDLRQCFVLGNTVYVPQLWSCWVTLRMTLCATPDEAAID